MPIEFGLPQQLPEEQERVRIFVCDGRILSATDTISQLLPGRDVHETLAPFITRELFVGAENGKRWTVCRVSSDCPEPGEWRFTHMRGLLVGMTRAQFDLLGRAVHLLHWDETTQFCGCCGTKNEWSSESEAKLCPACGYESFPRVAPAVIVAVTKGDQILLARGTRFTLPIYSVLAGFVEPGETLEDCVKREIFEEVGIRVTNIRYFDSQPWPFPNSLMIGFFADYESGEITMQDGEILEADWYTADAMPPGPMRLSIARRLIDAFVEGGDTFERK